MSEGDQIDLPNTFLKNFKETFPLTDSFVFWTHYLIATLLEKEKKEQQKLIEALGLDGMNEYLSMKKNNFFNFTIFYVLTSYSIKKFREQKINSVSLVHNHVR